MDLSNPITMQPATRAGIAERMAGIAPFHVMELLTRAKQLEAAGRSIIHMEVGEPDFLTPEPVIEAACAFARTGRVYYTPSLGLPALREEIAAWYQRRYGVTVPPDRVIVTSGASGALLLALGVLVDVGDEWLLPDPTYPCNRHFVRVFEGIPRGLPVGAAQKYQPTKEQVEAAWTPRTRGLLIASPSNPTGTLLDDNQLAGLANCVRTNGGQLVVDEIYHGLTYGRDAQTILQFADDAFVVNSFSKYFTMTGWRLGWMIAPSRFVRDIEKLAGNLFCSAPSTAQYAALAAFLPETTAILEARRTEFQARRDFLLPCLTKLGFQIKTPPEGAFYIYADCSALTNDSFGFARDLLEQAGVAITPGLDFGSHAPERHVRFAYTVSLDKLEDGVERIAAFLQRQ